MTLYHVVVEASLAQPGQHMIEASLEQLESSRLPQGMRNVSLDEQRHIGFGVKLLADLYQRTRARSRSDRRPHPRGAAVDLRGRQAAELGPHLHRVLRLHAGGSRRGRRDRDRAAPARGRAAGRHLPRFPMPMDLPPRERALRGQKLLRAGLIGPGDEGVGKTPRRWRSCSTRSPAGRSDGVRPGTTIAWDFGDARPGRRVDSGGRARPRAGPRAGRPHAPHVAGGLRRRVRGPGRRPEADAPAPAAAAGQRPAPARPPEGLRLTSVVRAALARRLSSSIEGGVSRSRPGGREPVRVALGIRDKSGTVRQIARARAAAHSLPSMMQFRPPQAPSGDRRRTGAPRHHKLARCRAMDEQGTSPGGVTRRRLMGTAAASGAAASAIGPRQRRRGRRRGDAGGRSTGRRGRSSAPASRA